MTAKETVLSLYKAYGSGDPAQIAALLHEDVVWVAPAGNATQVALGIGQSGDAGRGDLLVTVEVVVPQSLNEPAREALTSYGEAVGAGNPRARLFARTS